MLCTPFNTRDVIFTETDSKNHPQYPQLTKTTLGATILCSAAHRKLVATCNVLLRKAASEMSHVRRHTVKNHEAASIVTSSTLFLTSLIASKCVR